MARQTLPKRTLSEVESLDALAAAGIPTVPHRVVTSAEEAAKAARDLGYPVVLKIVSPDILHKSDIGGVALSLTSEDEVRDAFDRIMAKARAAAPTARLDGCLVATMIRGGVEVILGVQSDPTFGPMVMFGLGGLLVEVLHDVSFRAAPFDESEARRMIAETKAALVLKGTRGAPAGDIEALARTLSRLSVFASRHADQIKSIDINPVLVRPAGQGVVALDAVIIGASD
jgi:succinyl-CoA synthetase beta subunit